MEYETDEDVPKKNHGARNFRAQPQSVHGGG